MEFTGKVCHHFLTHGMPVKRTRSSMIELERAEAERNAIPSFHHHEHIDEHFGRKSKVRRLSAAQTDVHDEQLTDDEFELIDHDDEKMNDENATITAQKGTHLSCAVCGDQTTFCCVKCSITLHRPVAICGPAKRKLPRKYCMKDHIELERNKMNQPY
jgi:hypothetical protein